MAPRHYHDVLREDPENVFWEHPEYVLYEHPEEDVGEHAEDAVREHADDLYYVFLLIIYDSLPISARYIRESTQNLSQNRSRCIHVRKERLPAVRKNNLPGLR